MRSRVKRIIRIYELRIRSSVYNLEISGLKELEINDLEELETSNIGASKWETSIDWDLNCE